MPIIIITVLLAPFALIPPGAFLEHVQKPRMYSIDTTDLPIEWINFINTAQTCRNAPIELLVDQFIATDPPNIGVLQLNEVIEILRGIPYNGNPHTYAKLGGEAIQNKLWPLAD